jgi:hypothetical protein
MHIIIQYYNDKNPERIKEYHTSIQKNLDNPAIDRVHNIIEPETKVPQEFLNHPKHVVTILDKNEDTCNIKGRLTFRYAFKYANEHIGPNQVVGIINLDNFFDDSEAWLNVDRDFFSISNIDKVLCLSRYEWFWNESSKVEESQWKGASYDCWVFKTPLRDIPDCNFAVGNAPFCDNTITRRFFDCGYRVFNWAQKYKIFHLDLCRNHHNGYMITTTKTDKSAHQAALRGRLIVSPYDNDWEKFLTLREVPKYKLYKHKLRHLEKIT